MGVDAPCSSCGVLRRHPSQRWAIREADIKEIADVQRVVLREAAALVRPGGRLIYATCSLLREENQDVADKFEMDSAGDFEPWPFADVHWAAAKEASVAHHQRLLLPHVEGTDGFFMSRWRKRCI